MGRNLMLLRRLVPAAIGTATFAALAHAMLVGIAARTIGLELAAIAAFTFVVSVVLALAGGSVLLALVAALRLNGLASLLLFVSTVQCIAIWLQFYLFEFENGWADISWRYGLISAPASLIAWHLSVHHVNKHTRAYDIHRAGEREPQD